MSVIEVRGLHKSFGDNHVLRGVDLDVNEGENLVVLGRSGTGKSVLIKLLVGLLEPDAGEARVLGEPVFELPRKKLDVLRLRLGFSFQHSALYDSMTVRENLEFPVQMNRPDTSRADLDEMVHEVIASVGLEQSLDQMPSELSGGQRKRIGIARTLILKPEVMFYDEPTAGLDPATCGEINELMNHVRDAYKTTGIIITHDLTCARQCGDRVAMLDEGQVLKVGTFEEVFADKDPRISTFYEYNFTGSNP